MFARVLRKIPTEPIVYGMFAWTFWYLFQSVLAALLSDNTTLIYANTSIMAAYVVSFLSCSWKTKMNTSVPLAIASKIYFTSLPMLA